MTAQYPLYWNLPITEIHLLSHCDHFHSMILKLHVGQQLLPSNIS